MGRISLIYATQTHRCGSLFDFFGDATRLVVVATLATRHLDSPKSEMLCETHSAARASASRIGPARFYARPIARAHAGRLKGVCALCCCINKHLPATRRSMRASRHVTACRLPIFPVCASSAANRTRERSLKKKLLTVYTIFTRTLTHLIITKRVKVPIIFLLSRTNHIFITTTTCRRPSGTANTLREKDPR